MCKQMVWKSKRRSTPGPANAGAAMVNGSMLSTKALICTLVVLTALGGIAGHAIAGIDYSVRHMVRDAALPSSTTPG